MSAKQAQAAALQKQISLLDDCIQNIVDLRTKSTHIFEDVVSAADEGLQPPAAYLSDLRQINSANQALRGLAQKLDEYGVATAVNESLQIEMKMAVDQDYMDKLRQIKRRKISALSTAKNSLTFFEGRTKGVLEKLGANKETNHELDGHVSIKIINEAVAMVASLPEEKRISIRQLIRQPAQSLAALVLIIGDTMRVVISVRELRQNIVGLGTETLWVLDDLTVFAAQEKSKQPWEQSDHGVFKRVTVAAVLHFQRLKQTTPPHELLPKIVTWLCSYSNLFSAPCEGCGLLLHNDSHQFKFLPPIDRVWHAPTEQYRPFHPQCK